MYLQAFDPECEFHIKNKHKHSSNVHWPDLFGPDQAFATSPGTIVSSFYVSILSMAFSENLRLGNIFYSNIL